MTREPVRPSPATTANGVTPPPVTSAPQAEPMLEMLGRLVRVLEDISRELRSIDTSLMGTADRAADLARQTSADLVTAVDKHTRAVTAALDTLQRRFMA
jgi:ABC-type transporter Mla subunit MlaD